MVDGVEGALGQRIAFDAAKSMRAVFSRFSGLIQPELDNSLSKKFYLFYLDILPCWYAPSHIPSFIFP